MAGSKTWREVAPDVAQAVFGSRRRQWHDRRPDTHRSAVGRRAAGGPLLAQIDERIEKIIADGAYHGAPTYQTIAQRGADIEVVIPPRKTAVPATESHSPNQRDRHLDLISTEGRLPWQKATGYGRRALVETTMGRYKSLIGPRLRSRGFEAQQTEAAIGVVVLNSMLAAARPNSVRNQKMAA